ncbi:uncharacterized protein LOC144440212 isoform X2 [Glandiceps talaboti]
MKLIPKDTPKELIQLMVDCWHQDPKKRPQFIDVLSRLKSIAEKYKSDMHTIIGKVVRELEQGSSDGRAKTGIQSDTLDEAVMTVQQKPIRQPAVKPQKPRIQPAAAKPKRKVRKVEVLSEDFLKKVAVRDDGSSQWSEERIGRSGEGPAEFNDPRGMAMTPTDLLLVCDKENQRIQILNKEFQCLDCITVTDEFPQPFEPWDIAVSHDNQYFIYDDGNKQIIVTNQNKKIIRIICQSEDLWGITVMGNFVLATDYYGHRLIKFTTMGDKVTEVKGQVQSKGQFSEPWSVAVTSDQKVVMSHDKGIHFYDSNLKFLSSYDHSFNAAGLCVDKRNNIYICDWSNHRVVMVTENREFVVVHSDIWSPCFIEISDEKTTKIFITHRWVYGYDYITVLTL